VAEGAVVVEEEVVAVIRAAEAAESVAAQVVVEATRVAAQVVVEATREAALAEAAALAREEVRVPADPEDQAVAEAAVAATAARTTTTTPTISPG
jgi:hypothetical protein